MVIDSTITGDNVSVPDVAIDEGDNTITVEVLPPSFVAAQKKTYTLTIIVLGGTHRTMPG